MTILPEKNNNKINFWFSVLLGSLVVIAFLGVFLYNWMVNLKHESSDLKISLRETEVKNADLKNNLYIATNPIQLNNQPSNNLIIEKNPEYVKGDDNFQASIGNQQLTVNNR